jgi:hypothetical protein
MSYRLGSLWAEAASLALVWIALAACSPSPPSPPSSPAPATGTVSGEPAPVSISQVVNGGPSCSAVTGTLSLRAKVPRASGISPLLVFFDATGTTDSANLGGANNSFQDVYYSWSFGDSGASGTGNWPSGANPGHNSRNTAIGGVAAHLYVTNGADSDYTVTVTAYDGTNTASCQLGVTAHDPSGANGFPRSATTCIAAASTPVAGSGGCPAGARVAVQSNIGTAISSYLGNNKRALFRCGDTFTGQASLPYTLQTATIGAYGGCENSTATRPIWRNSSGNTLTLVGSNSALATPVDVRVTDIDFEDGTHNATGLGNMGGGEVTQLTLYNLNCTGLSQCWFVSSATQSGLIASTEVGMKQTQGVYWNYAANQCAANNGLDTLYCGAASYDPSNYYPIQYNAIIGNSIDGIGSPASDTGYGYEAFRVSACRMCVFSNNTFANSNNVGAVFKFNSANTYNSSPVWIGQYAEYNEISDNLFTGSSGTVIAGYAPENNSYDERLRYAVIEGNYIKGVVCPGCGATKFLIGAVSTTVRNNVTFVPSGDTGALLPSDFNWQISQVGVEPVAAAIELYHNTCYALTTQSGCIGFIGGDGARAAGINSWAQNTLFYNDGSKTAAVTDNGSGNTVSNNTASSAADPKLANASGSFGLISDFRPTQGYSGVAIVPVWYDALGIAWRPGRSLGAVKP